MGDTAVAGTAVKHAATAHFKSGHGAFRVRGGRGHQFAEPARGRARYAGRAYYRTRGGHWGDWGGTTDITTDTIV